MTSAKDIAAARTFSAVVLVAISLVVAACGSDGDASGQFRTIDIPDPSGGATTPDTPLGEFIEQLEEQGSREEKVLSDAEAVGPVLNDFWTAELSDVYGVTFDPPDRYEYYRSTANSPCGDTNQALPRNAYYCHPDQDEYVAFDLDWFQEYLVDDPGGATTFLILAHEWGHAVQDTWLENGGNDTWQPPHQKELNADCLAGVFIGSSVRDGTIVEEVGDADAMFGWLYESGRSPWLDPGSHGTSDQRIDAFVDGLQQGTDYCRRVY